MSDTLQVIDRVLGRINVHPEYNSSVKQFAYETRLKDAEHHSLDVELMGQSQQPGFFTKKERAERMNALESLSRGWEYLRAQGKHRLTLPVLAGLGKIVEPSNQSSEFRKLQVAFGGFYPPMPDQLYQQADNLVWYLANTTAHPVIRAAEAHIQLVQIHPYEDGNGRAARLLQSFCLTERGYPAAIIPSSEREHYIALMKDVLKVRYNRDADPGLPSEQDKRFYSYLSGKVLSSLQHIDRTLAQQRYFAVRYDSKTPHDAEHLASAIRSYGRTDRGRSVKTALDRHDGKAIYVLGHISLEQLDSVLKKHAQRNYKIDVNPSSCPHKFSHD